MSEEFDEADREAIAKAIEWTARMWEGFGPDARYFRSLLESGQPMSLEMALYICDQTDLAIDTWWMGLPAWLQEKLIPGMLPQLEELQALKERNAESAKRHIAEHERRKRCH